MFTSAVTLSAFPRWRDSSPPSSDWMTVMRGPKPVPTMTPGWYTAKLTVNGRDYTKNFQVLDDKWAQDRWAVDR